MADVKTIKSYKISLDIKKQNDLRPIFEVADGDTGNVIDITLMDGKDPISLLDCLVNAVFKSINNNYNASQSTGKGITVSENRVIIELYKDSVIPGNVLCELQIFSGADKKTLVTTTQFLFKCRKVIADENTVRTQPSWPLLVEMVAAEQGRVAAETLRVTAEQLRETYHNSLKTLYQTAYAAAVTNGYTGTETEFYALVTDVYNSKIAAAGSAASAAQALSDLLAMIGTDICPLVGGQVPVDRIPLVLVHNIVQITDEAQLTTLTSEQVQLNDIATLIEGEGDAKKRVKSWQLLGDDPSIRANWVEVAVDYASTAAYATTAGTAENANTINGHRLVEMTPEQYELAVKDPETYYLVG